MHRSSSHTHDPCQNHSYLVHAQFSVSRLFCILIRPIPEYDKLMSQMDELKLLRHYKALKIKSEHGNLSDIEKDEYANLRDKLAFALTKEPKSKEDFERRRQLRATTNFTVRCKTPRELQNVYAKNISGGGLFITTNRPPALGATVSCEIQLPGDPDLIPVKGQVVWVNDAGVKNLESGIGVKFTQITATNRKRIEHAVTGLIQKTLHDHSKKG